MAIIQDSFTRPDELLDADAAWTKLGGAGGSELGIVSNQLQLTAASGARRAYHVADQGDPDMVVQAAVPNLLLRSNTTANQIVLRMLDAGNYIGLGVSESNSCAVGIRVGTLWSEFASTTVLPSDVIALKLEAEGTDVRAYYDIGAGWVQFHTENGVTDLQTETLAGFVANTNAPGTVVWDDFETGALADYVAADPVGYQVVEEIFHYDELDTYPFTYGTTYYFNPNSTGGTGTGLSDANAFYTAQQINAKNFTPGDKLLFRAGTDYVTDRIITNNTMQGDGVDEFFYLGAYHMVGATETPGLGGEARPIIRGIEAAALNYPGPMTQADFAGMIPLPAISGGIMQDGSQSGVFNMHGYSPLHLRFGDIAIIGSGGRGIRWSNGAGLQTGGLLVQNIYIEGTMKQNLHCGGVRDVIIEDSWFTKADMEQLYGAAPGNNQAHIGTKAREDTTPTPGGVNTYDDPTNFTMRRNVLWDSVSSDGIITNSGEREIYILDNVLIDTGHVFSIYVDRTYNCTVTGNIVIRTAREVWHDWDGTPIDNRGGVGIGIQNEKSPGSFPWDELNTEQDFLNYASQRVVIAFNIVAGYQDNYGLISQASTAADAQPAHLGAPHGAGCYFYNNMSLDPTGVHFDNPSAAPVENYVLRDDIPQRMWANLFWNGSEKSGENDLADRNDSQFDLVWTNNYKSSDIPTMSNFDRNQVTTGVEMPLASYFDMSPLMTVDADDWMNYTNVRAFLTTIGVNPDNLSDRDLAIFRPTANVLSGITADSLTLPPGNTYPDQFRDIEGIGLPTSLYFGPFQTVGASEENPPTIYNVYYRLLAG